MDIEIGIGKADLANMKDRQKLLFRNTRNLQGILTSQANEQLDTKTSEFFNGGITRIKYRPMSYTTYSQRDKDTLTLVMIC